jgi:hypothetical protein
MLVDKPVPEQWRMNPELRRWAALFYTAAGVAADFAVSRKP